MTSISRLRHCRTATLSLGIACALPAFAALAQESATSDTQTLDRIQVTGSRIRQVDVENAAPVLTISRADIE